MSEGGAIGSGELGCAAARNGDRQGLVLRRLGATSISGAEATGSALEGGRLLLQLGDFDRCIGLVGPQALGIASGHDAKAKQNDQNP